MFSSVVELEHQEIVGLSPCWLDAAEGNAGSIVETLDKIGCLSIVSAHLHGVFDLLLDTRNTIYI